MTYSCFAPFKVSDSVQITPEVYGKWAHEFQDKAASATVAFSGYPDVDFKVKGQDTGTELYTVGTSLAVSVDETSNFFFTYAYDFNDTMTGHTFELGYLYSF